MFSTLCRSSHFPAQIAQLPYFFRIGRISLSNVHLWLAKPIPCFIVSPPGASFHVDPSDDLRSLDPPLLLLLSPQSKTKNTKIQRYNASSTVSLCGAAAIFGSAFATGVRIEKQTRHPKDHHRMKEKSHNKAAAIPTSAPRNLPKQSTTNTNN